MTKAILATIGILAVGAGWLLMRNWPIRVIEHVYQVDGATSDQEWAEKDHGIREHLARLGDDGSRPRPVDHLTIFRTREAANEYARFVGNRGYTVSPSTVDPTRVEFRRVAAIKSGSFDQELKALRAKAKDLGGGYDGWGCTPSRG